MFLSGIPLYAVELPTGFDCSAAGDMAVLDGGRFKPLDTFAGESLKTLTGRWKFKETDHLAMLFSLLAQPDWTNDKLIRLDYRPLKETLGLDAQETFFSYNELAANPHFQQWADRVIQKSGADQKLNRLEQETSALMHQLNLFQDIVKGDAIHIVPPPPGSPPNADWLSIVSPASYSQEIQNSLKQGYQNLLAAVRTHDAKAFEQAGRDLKNQLTKLNPEIYPPLKDLQREIYFNRSRPFLNAWIYYLLAFLMFLVSFFYTNRILYWASFIVFNIGFVYHSLGLILRSLISGRAPVSNMYESVIFVGWGVILFALVFEIVYRRRWIIACASFLGVCMLILADILPFDSNIEPLVPVLRNNYWLIVHVLTITISYSAFALAMGLAHIVMAIYFYFPQRIALLKELSLFIYRVLQVGVVLLAAGTILGGVWAAESWGRFWGWDPKETWALISLLGYMVILHARSIGWLRDFGTAVGSILGFWLILMTWYGVNFVLASGLHSYGFGSGGGKYVLLYLGLELLFLIMAGWKYKLFQEAEANQIAASATAK